MDTLSRISTLTDKAMDKVETHIEEYLAENTDHVVVEEDTFLAHGYITFAAPNGRWVYRFGHDGSCIKADFYALSE